MTHGATPIQPTGIVKDQVVAGISHTERWVPLQQAVDLLVHASRLNAFLWIVNGMLLLSLELCHFWRSYSLQNHQVT